MDMDDKTCRRCDKFARRVDMFLPEEGLDYEDREIKAHILKDLKNRNLNLANMADSAHRGNIQWDGFHLERYINEDLSFKVTEDAVRDSTVLMSISSMVSDLTSDRYDLMDRVKYFKDALNPNLDSFNLAFSSYCSWDKKIEKRFINLHRKHFEGYKSELEGDVENYAMLSGDEKEFEREKLEVKIGELEHLCWLFGEKGEKEFGSRMLNLFDENVKRGELVEEKARLYETLKSFAASGSGWDSFIEEDYNTFVEVCEKLGGDVKNFRDEFRDIYIKAGEESAVDFAYSSIRDTAIDLACSRPKKVLKVLDPIVLKKIEDKKKLKIAALLEDSEKLFY